MISKAIYAEEEGPSVVSVYSCTTVRYFRQQSKPLVTNSAVSISDLLQVQPTSKYPMEFCIDFSSLQLTLLPFVLDCSRKETATPGEWKLKKKPTPWKYNSEVGRFEPLQVKTIATSASDTAGLSRVNSLQPNSHDRNNRAVPTWCCLQANSQRSLQSYLE